MWTREAYAELIDQGFFEQRPNVELIEGEILLIPPQGRDHIGGVAYPTTTGDRFLEVRLCQPEDSVFPLFAPAVEVRLASFFLQP